MSERVLWLLFLVLAIGLAVTFGIDSRQQPVRPGPSCPDTKPEPKPEPKKPILPWRQDASASVEAEAEAHVVGQALRGKISLGGPIAPDSKTEVQVDLPVEQRIKNIGSYRDGAGMCVMSSVEMAARWAGLEQMRGLRDWCAKQPGGANPPKVDRQLKEYCAARGIACPPYVQYMGQDPAVLELVLATGRLACTTYSGADGVRYRGRISHMVCIACFRTNNEWGACVLDNNGRGSPGVGENELLWMSPAELLQRAKDSRSGYWLFAWLAPGPFPVLTN